MEFLRPLFVFDRLFALDWLRPDSRMHWMYLLSALVMAVLVYFWDRQENNKTSLTQFLFPRSVWLHRSALTDYLFVGITMPLWLLLASPYLLSSITVADQTLAAFRGWLGAWQVQSDPRLAVTVTYTLVLLLAGDFARYWAHRCLHRFPLLWEFHKVHHSAEVLTPITVYRMHPVEQVFVGLIAAVVVGVVTGTFLYLFPYQLSPVTVLGVNAGRFAFNLLGVHLRHSHIWLSFGGVVEHVILSPAQHQIHHSNDSRHFDRNFGFEFSIWDWMFGSLYITGRRPEVSSFGLGDEENRRLSTFAQLLLQPFAAAAKQIFGSKAGA